MAFIKKNLNNLADFAQKYDIPDEVGCAATDDIMAMVQRVLQGSMDQENPSETMAEVNRLRKPWSGLSLWRIFTR